MNRLASDKAPQWVMFLDPDKKPAHAAGWFGLPLRVSVNQPTIEVRAHSRIQPAGDLERAQKLHMPGTGPP